MMDPNIAHPAFVIEHQYAITDTMPEIVEYKKKVPKGVPVLRDLAGSSYIRQEGNGMLIGEYFKAKERASRMEHCSYRHSDFY